jgi:pimeloyl-ACP methyl ester carboxylesterase
MTGVLRRATMKTPFPSICAASIVMLVAGCAPPIGINRLSPEDANRALTANIFTTKTHSSYSARVLQRRGLTERFYDDPRGVLAELHAGFGGYDDDERLLALSELSFEYGLKSGDRAYFIAAAAYAWAFVFPEGENPWGGPYGDRLRFAADLYERGLGLGFAGDHGKLDLSPRSIPLPFGSLEVVTRAEQFVYQGWELCKFVSLADLDVRGLSNRYRRRGIGAPLAASVCPLEGAQASRWIGPLAKVPVTFVLRFPEPRKELREGHLHGVIEVHNDLDETETTVGTVQVPLEADPSAALAYQLDGSPIWDFEIAGFRKGDFTFAGDKTSNLRMLGPHKAGHIPIVFVHGTASSPARWAEMTNELMSDPRISSRYEFWYYMYNSGQPIALSASKLRDALTAAVSDFDPGGRDPELKRMVVMGHSQGGLLTKMTVVDSGTKFWDAVSKVPFEEAAPKLPEDAREEIEHAMFVKPLPFVRRVVFIATPHLGSYLTERRLSNLARRLITLPANLVHTSQALVQLDMAGVFRQPFRMPTSLDNMNAKNPFLLTLHSLPIESNVTANSIIPVKGGKAHVPDGDDGVVAYKSAHIEPVESELVVDSPHSVQANPHAIEEVRRILYEHVGLKPGLATVPAVR